MKGDFYHHRGMNSPQSTKPLQQDKGATDVFIEKADHDIHYKTLSWQVRIMIQYDAYRHWAEPNLVRFSAHDSGNCEQRNVVTSLVCRCCWYERHCKCICIEPLTRFVGIVPAVVLASSSSRVMLASTMI